MIDAAVCVLAGGEATRLPGKLALPAGEVPMLVRVVRNVRGERPVWLSVKGPLPEELDALLDAPRVQDRWALRGPLSGLLSTFDAMDAEWVFACAGDAPFLTAAFVDRLAAYASLDLEAVVPAHDDEGRRIEPLAALYRREAFLREGLPLLESGQGALRLVIDRLKTRFVRVDDERIFANVNTPAEYAAVREAFA